MSKINININGTSFSSEGESLEIINGEIFVDGKKVDGAKTPEKVIVKLDGELKSLKVQKGSVVCGNVNGNVDAGGSVSCENVTGDVDSGGSVNCDNVGGNIDAGGSVNCGDVKGSIDAGGSVVSM